MYSNLCNDHPKIIALCEDHDIKMDRIKNGYLISELYEDGDVVLVESTEKEPINGGPQVQFVNKKIRVYGWDSDEARKAIYDIGKNVIALIDRIEALKNEIHEVSKDVFFKKTQDIVSLIPECYRFGSLPFLMQSADIFFEFKEGTLVYLLKAVQYYGQRNWTVMAFTNQDREQALINKIEEVKNKYNKIFVIAGPAHIIGTIICGEQLCTNIQATYDYLHNNNSIVLEPDPSSNALDLPIQKDEIKCEKTNENVSRAAADPWHPNTWTRRINALMATYEQDEVIDDQFASLSFGFFKTYKRTLPG
jgi:hypothetical protein